MATIARDPGDRRPVRKQRSKHSLQPLWESKIKLENNFCCWCDCGYYASSWYIKTGKYDCCPECRMTDGLQHNRKCTAVGIDEKRYGKAQ